MQTIAKITPADYPDLLAAVDAGMTQRELARRYDCAPSLIARHLARAKRSREPGEPVRGRDPSVTTEPHSGSLREILEARIRDPKTSARDLASLLNALAKLDEEASPRAESFFPPGTLIIQPGERGVWPSTTFTLLARVRNGFERYAEDADAAEVSYLVASLLGLVFTEEEARAVLAERDALHAEAEPSDASAR